MSNLFVLRDFKQYAASQSATFALGTTVEMKKVVLFTTPAIAYTVMEGAVEKLNEAAAKQAQGGTQATAYKNQCLEELYDLRDKQADYVQTTSNGVLSVLLSSGFKAASTNVGQSPLETPVVVMLNNPMSEQLGVRIGPVRNAKSYEVRYHNGDGVL